MRPICHSLDGYGRTRTKHELKRPCRPVYYTSLLRQDGTGGVGLSNNEDDVVDRVTSTRGTETTGVVSSPFFFYS